MPSDTSIVVLPCSVVEASGVVLVPGAAVVVAASFVDAVVTPGVAVLTDVEVGVVVVVGWLGRVRVDPGVVVPVGNVLPVPSDTSILVVPSVVDFVTSSVVDFATSVVNFVTSPVVEVPGCGVVRALAWQSRSHVLHC